MGVEVILKAYVSLAEPHPHYAALILVLLLTKGYNPHEPVEESDPHDPRTQIVTDVQRKLYSPQHSLERQAAK